MKKRDLRQLLPPSEADIAELAEMLANPPHEAASEEGFTRFYSTLHANQCLEKYRKGQDRPLSIASLIETIMLAYTINQVQVQRSISITKSLLKKLINNKTEPTQIAIDVYVKLATSFQLNFETLRSAILGSYVLFIQHDRSAPVRFARSSVHARTREKYPGEMKAAYDELHQKSALLRAEKTGTQKINVFLEELKKCLT